MPKVDQSTKPKTGGRVKGTPNKRTLDIQQRLDELNCCPIEGMAVLAMDKANTPELRGKMFAELAQYVAPKRRAVEVQGPAGDAMQKQILLIESADALVAKIRGGER